MQLPKPATLLLSEINADDRIREDLGDIDKLAASIVENGLIVPLIVRHPDNRLIDGGRRYAALTQLKVERVPVYYREEISDSQLRLLELEANLRRKEMTWQESCRSIAEVHKLQVNENAREGIKWTREQTGDLLGVSRANVNYCVTIATLLEAGDESINTQPTLRDALRTLLKRKEDAAIAQLTAKNVGVAVNTLHPDLKTSKFWNITNEKETTSTLVSDVLQYGEVEDVVIEEIDLSDAEALTAPDTKDVLSGQPAAVRPLRVHLSKFLHNCDALDYMRNNRAFCSHIITDPPYGIDMDMFEQTNQGQNVERVRHTHDVDKNMQLLREFCTLAYDSIFEHGGYCCIWCDIMQWELLYKSLSEAGFKVARWPIVWCKDHTCINSAPQFNFTKKTEFCIIARKGNATLIEPQITNIVSADSNQYRHLFGNHPFVKPPECWEFLMNAVSYEGQIIFDPFAGVGSSLNTFIRGGRKFIACEIDKVHYDTLYSDTKRWLSGMLSGNVEFV